MGRSHCTVDDALQEDVPYLTDHYDKKYYVKINCDIEAKGE